MHNYRINADDALKFAALLDHQSQSSLAGIRDISSARRETIPYGALVLERLIKQMKPRTVVVSVFGIREGLLYSLLGEQEKRRDPLIAACEDLARSRSRSLDSAYELCFWTDALFRAPGPTETPEQRRLRHAACLLSDIGWRAHPDYRGAQSLNLVAHGDFVGVDHSGRAFLALTVYYRNEGLVKDELSQKLIELVDKDMVKRARILGAAFRAAHMVSAAMPGVLTNTPITYEGNRLVWALPEPFSNLEGERVERQFKELGLALTAKRHDGSPSGSPIGPLVSLFRQFLVAKVSIHDVAQWIAVDKPPEIVEEQVQAPFVGLRRVIATMRGHDHTGMLPERRGAQAEAPR